MNDRIRHAIAAISNKEFRESIAKAILKVVYGVAESNLEPTETIVLKDVFINTRAEHDITFSNFSQSASLQPRLIIKSVVFHYSIYDFLARRFKRKNGKVEYEHASMSALEALDWCEHILRAARGMEHPIANKDPKDANQESKNFYDKVKAACALVFRDLGGMKDKEIKSSTVSAIQQFVGLRATTNIEEADLAEKLGKMIHKRLGKGFPSEMIGDESEFLMVINEYGEPVIDEIAAGICVPRFTRSDYAWENHCKGIIQSHFMQWKEKAETLRR